MPHRRPGGIEEKRWHRLSGLEGLSITMGEKCQPCYQKRSILSDSGISIMRSTRAMSSSAGM